MSMKNYENILANENHEQRKDKRKSWHGENQCDCTKTEMDMVRTHAKIVMHTHVLSSPQATQAQSLW